MTRDLTAFLPLRRIVERYFSFLDRLAAFIHKLCVLLLAIVVLVVIYRVVMRYIFASSPIWASELATYLTIWMALLFSGALVWSDNHLQVEVVFQKFSRKSQIRLRTAELVVICGIAIMMIIYGEEYALGGLAQTSPTLGVSMFYAYAAIPAGGWIILLFAVGKLLEINMYPDTLEKDFLRKYRSDEVEARGVGDD